MLQLLDPAQRVKHAAAATTSSGAAATAANHFLNARSCVQTGRLVLVAISEKDHWLVVGGRKEFEGAM